MFPTKKTGHMYYLHETLYAHTRHEHTHCQINSELLTILTILMFIPGSHALGAKSPPPIIPLLTY